MLLSTPWKNSTNPINSTQFGSFRLEKGARIKMAVPKMSVHVDPKFSSPNI